MLVIGIDPGLTRLGVGIVESFGARQMKFVDAKVITTNKDNPLDARLVQIGNTLGEIFELYKPDCVAIERVFSQENRISAMDTSAAFGVAIYQAGKMGIAIAPYTPTQIKAAVSGYGGADKKQIQFMVQKILKLPKLPKPPDLADALAIAICQILNPQNLQSDWNPSSTATQAQKLWANALKQANKK